MNIPCLIGIISLPFLVREIIRNTVKPDPRDKFRDALPYCIVMALVLILLWISG